MKKPTLVESRDTRRKLHMTQVEFARLMGVHHLTISKWDRRLVRPNPYQQALMTAYDDAVTKRPYVAQDVRSALRDRDTPIAMYLLLRAIYE